MAPFSADVKNNANESTGLESTTVCQFWAIGRIITANAVHAVVDAGQKIRRVRHRVVVGRQAGATVAGLLPAVLGDAGQIRIHLVGHRLLLLLILARQQVLIDVEEDIVVMQSSGLTLFVESQSYLIEWLDLLLALLQRIDFAL